MVLLALDTSAAVSVALVDGAGQPITLGATVLESRKHAETLAPLIDAEFAAAGLTPQDVTAVAVGTGPAPFTGLRVGLVTARTFGLARNVPVLGVCSLEVIAAQAAEQGVGAPGELSPGGRQEWDVIVVTDARRREVYWARYRVSRRSTHGTSHSELTHDVAAYGRQTGGVFPGPVTDVGLVLLAGPDVATAATVAEHAHGAAIVGAGALLYPRELPLAQGAPLRPDPAMLGRVALANQQAGKPTPTEPLYLRRPDIHEATDRKRVSEPVAATEPATAAAAGSAPPPGPGSVPPTAPAAAATTAPADRVR